MKNRTRPFVSSTRPITMQSNDKWLCCFIIILNMKLCVDKQLLVLLHTQTRGGSCVRNLCKWNRMQWSGRESFFDIYFFHNIQPKSHFLSPSGDSKNVRFLRAAAVTWMRHAHGHALSTWNLFRLNGSTRSPHGWCNYILSNGNFHGNYATKYAFIEIIAIVW